MDSLRDKGLMEIMEDGDEEEEVVVIGKKKCPKKTKGRTKEGEQVENPMHNICASGVELERTEGNDAP